MMGKLCCCTIGAMACASKGEQVPVLRILCLKYCITWCRVCLILYTLELARGIEHACRCISVKVEPRLDLGPPSSGR